MLLQEEEMVGRSARHGRDKIEEKKSRGSTTLCLLPYGGFGDDGGADDSEDEDSDRLEDDCSELKWSEGTEARLSFPTADIYAALPVWVGDQPSSYNLYQIYHGKPKWTKAAGGDEGLLRSDNVGEDAMQAVLPRNKYLVLSSDVLVGCSDSPAPYSEEDLEYLEEEEGDDYSESLPEQLRKDDVMNFILGKL